MKAILLTLGLCLLAPHAEAAYSPFRQVGHAHHGAAHVSHHRHAGARVAVHQHGGGGNLCTDKGRCATVVSWAADRFRGLVHDLEAMGYAIGSPGCLSSGHMAHSKHHWGGACDLFNQYARNRTLLRQPPPAVQIDVARRHGLTSGCVWRNPDCGHFEVPTGGAYAMVHRRRV